MSTEVIFQIIILLMSVVIHEVSHGYVAYMQGDPTAKLQGRLTLNPIKHIDPIGSILVPIITLFAGFGFGWAKPVPFNPYNLRNQRWGELYVAAAGPASNILIAVLFGLLVRFGQGLLPGTFIGVCIIVVIINLGLALFNLIPIPPLDGSKILGAFLPFRFQQIWRSFEQYSMIFVLIIILIPAFSRFLSLIVITAFTVITGISF